MARQCIRHRMPNGTIMDGPPHGRGQQCIEWSDDIVPPPHPGGGYKKGGRARKKNKGGLLRGPKHERGGIPARLQGGGEVELEGGEYIVNAQTVNAVGTQFLDELNSTATTYHKGGYSQGQLPSPSRYKRGGKVMPKRSTKKRLARGGRQKMRHGGSHNRSMRDPYSMNFATTPGLTGGRRRRQTLAGPLGRGGKKSVKNEPWRYDPLWISWYNDQNQNLRGCSCIEMGNYGSFCVGQQCYPSDAGNPCPTGGSCPCCYDPQTTCFVAGTKVKIGDGTEKNIEDVVVGDTVVGHTQTNTVVELDPTPLGDRKLYSFNGGPYFVTSDHPVLTADGWKSIKPEETRKRDGEELYNELVGELKEGDILITTDGEVELKSIKSKGGHDPSTQLYNFFLDGDNSYGADGYFVHNKVIFRPPIGPGPKPHIGYGNGQKEMARGGRVGRKMKHGGNMLAKQLLNPYAQWQTWYDVDDGSSRGCHCNSSHRCEGTSCAHGVRGTLCNQGQDCAGGPDQRCFIAGTNVAMSDGTVRNIEDVAVDDIVKSWNEETKELSDAKVTKLNQPIHDDMIIVEWEQATNTNTFDHPYWVANKGWSSYKPDLTLERYEFDEVQQLEVGDAGLFLTESGELIESKLLSIKEKVGKVQTYIFELNKDNTFFANSILVHNKINPPPDRPGPKPHIGYGNGNRKPRRSMARGGRARNRMQGGGGSQLVGADYPIIPVKNPPSGRITWDALCMQLCCKRHNVGGVPVPTGNRDYSNYCLCNGVPDDCKKKQPSPGEPDWRRGGSVKQNRKKMKHGGTTTYSQKTSGFTQGGEFICITNKKSKGCGSGYADTYNGYWWTNGNIIYGGLQTNSSTVAHEAIPTLRRITGGAVRSTSTNTYIQSNNMGTKRKTKQMRRGGPSRERGLPRVRMPQGTPGIPSCTYDEVGWYGWGHGIPDCNGDNNACMQSCAEFCGGPTCYDLGASACQGNHCLCFCIPG